jgi:death on curing protein
VAPIFLRLEEVLAIHAEMIRRYGGSYGIRDLGLLEAAIAFFRQHTHRGGSE